MKVDRGTKIKNIRSENKKLEEDTEKMMRELEKIKILKEKQLEKLIKKEQEGPGNEIKEQKRESKQKGTQPQILKLHNYGNQVAKHNEARVKKQLNKIVVPDSSESEKEGEEDNDGENLRYFLQVMAMEEYFPAFKANKILTLPKLRNLKEAQLKEMQIPIKDHVKIIKKIRQMGF